jgi:VWFA-related protein
MGIVLAGAVVFLAPVTTAAQETPVFPAGVEVVQIEVQATDDEGAPVTDLRPAEFALKENGQEQEIELVRFVAGPGTRATRVVAPEPEPVGPNRRGPARAYTWLYVAPEVQRPDEFARAAGPLRAFIKDLPTGFLVSLAGLPFTDNKRLLLASLERMVDQPFGAEPGQAAVVDPALGLQDELEFEREVFAALQRQNGILTSFVGMHHDPPSVPRADDLSGMVSVEKIDRQMIFFGELPLLRYLDLIERMAAFPGKKMILLYRSGLRLHAAQSHLVDEIAAAALRHRVSVFAFDPRGLEADAPVEDRRVRFAWEAGRRRPLQDQLGIPEAREQDVNGLLTLARVTGGRSVVDSNDATAILRDVLDESSDYYVLGYVPRDRRESGRFRRLEVSVSRPGVELRTLRGYYERRPFEELSTREKSVALYRSLLSGAPSDLEVKASLTFFAAPKGRTAMVFSAGVRPDVLAAKKRGQPDLEATVLVRVRNRVFESMPVLLEQELRPDVRSDFLDEAADDETIYLAYNGRVDLPPGRYSLGVLFRDDRSGRMGILEEAFEAPRLTGQSVPSSLLLTRQAERRDGSPVESSRDHASPDDVASGDPLEVGELRLTPEPAAAVRPGDVVYCTYHLYNATPEDFTVAEQGMQMGLLRGGEWIGPGEVSAGGQAFPDREGGLIRYGGWVDTRGLPPGRYTLLAVLPNYRTREVPDLSADFEVVE